MPPRAGPFDHHHHRHPPHVVLRGLPTDDIRHWVFEVTKTAQATGCYHLFFPDEAPDDDDDDDQQDAGRVPGTWQNLARELQRQSAGRILTDFIGGRVWALMLADDRGGGAGAGAPLLARPALALELAARACAEVAAAPVSEAQRAGMLRELEHGDPVEYPSDEHYGEAMEWLEVAVHLSTSREAVGARARTRDGVSRMQHEVERRRCAEGPPRTPPNPRRRVSAGADLDMPEPERRKRFRQEMRETRTDRG